MLVGPLYHKVAFAALSVEWKCTTARRLNLSAVWEVPGFIYFPSLLDASRVLNISPHVDSLLHLSFMPSTR